MLFFIGYDDSAYQLTEVLTYSKIPTIKHLGNIVVVGKNVQREKTYWKNQLGIRKNNLQNLLKKITQRIKIIFVQQVYIVQRNNIYI